MTRRLTPSLATFALVTGLIASVSARATEQLTSLPNFEFTSKKPTSLTENLAGCEDLPADPSRIACFRRNAQIAGFMGLKNDSRDLMLRTQFIGGVATTLIAASITMAYLTGEMQAAGCNAAIGAVKHGLPEATSWMQQCEASITAMGGSMQYSMGANKVTATISAFNRSFGR